MNDLKWSQTDIMGRHLLQSHSKLEYYYENESGTENPEFNKSGFK